VGNEIRILNAACHRRLARLVRYLRLHAFMLCKAGAYQLGTTGNALVPLEKEARASEGSAGMRNGIGAFIAQIAAIGLTGVPFGCGGLATWKPSRPPMSPCPDCNKPTRGVFDPKGRHVSARCYGCQQEHLAINEQAAPAIDLPSGQTGSPLPGAALNRAATIAHPQGSHWDECSTSQPINPAHVAAAGTANRQNSAGRDVAGEE
jgi:hypothetical protein